MFLLVLTQAKLLYTLQLSKSLMGQMLVFANPFKWEMLERFQQRQVLVVLFKGVTSRNLTSGVYGKKGGRLSLQSRDLWDWVCHYSSPALVLQL